ncbi:Uncharacterised protein [Budvicia aquatica]|uniref:Uncharacterized protein n=1 Tax=Budvicia aquatica TaxID=82979 RepID=A0A484ZMJ7_9GAMM|nr:Uncharacterised protein [Budvicia aquatica]
MEVSLYRVYMRAYIRIVRVVFVWVVDSIKVGGDINMDDISN